MILRTYPFNSSRAELTMHSMPAGGTMQLTYNESRAICIQDPNAMEAPSGQDPFRSSFRSTAALAQAPAQAPAPVRPSCLPRLHYAASACTPPGKGIMPSVCSESLLVLEV